MQNIFLLYKISSKLLKHNFKSAEFLTTAMSFKNIHYNVKAKKNIQFLETHSRSNQVNFHPYLNSGAQLFGISVKDQVILRMDQCAVR